MKIDLEEKFAGITERDSHSKALLNTDTEALLQYKIKKQKSINQRRMANELDFLKTKVADLSSDITDIKTLLTELVSNR